MNRLDWMCSLPWVGFSNDPDGKVRPCCLFKNYITKDDGTFFYVQKDSVHEIFSSTFMKNLRTDFRNGKKPVECEICIKDESNNYESKRLVYQRNELFNNIDFSNEPEYPVDYQMILSNACNLKCRSCSPSHSNSWQAEYKMLKGHPGYYMPYGQSGDKNSVLWKTRDEWTKNLKRIEIVGGEPFFIKQWQELLNELISNGLSKEIILDITSNGTIFLENEINYLIDNFKFISLGLSIDGVNEIYNYLRHPGKWNEVEKNILKYYELFKERNDKFHLSIYHTVGWLNVWYLPDFHMWVKNNFPYLKIWNNIIHNPRHMSLIMIPEVTKNIIKNKLNQYNWENYNSDIQGIINFMISEQPSDEEIKNEYKIFTQHDIIRNEKIYNVVPKEFDILKNYFN